MITLTNQEPFEIHSVVMPFQGAGEFILDIAVQSSIFCLNN